MKWTRAVRHLWDLAEKCAELDGPAGAIYQVRVVGLWAVGDVLGEARDVDRVTVALAVDLPVDEVPWRSEPAGAEHWGNATRMTRNPITPLWRSARGPVWNHRVERPVLVWDSAGGVAEETLAALEAGRGDRLRPPAPSADELRERLRDELDVSLRALRGRTHAYEEKRWRPGKLDPVADDLWRAGVGYLDVLDALERTASG
ncbi:hypothetical protein [Saccharothrix longispora]|uniref:DUF7711 family protein n=1 Tax=Saccharothrix longispora TaxID=33920 RepID=UPI0028FD0710|nr:hypothetical protein [Saccharothrix longispora]MDU0289052.1 hypothetical protein [Saccharothrix longispora]